MTVSEIPGIYAGYVVNSTRYGGDSGITVGVAAESEGSAGLVYSNVDAIEKHGFGAMTRLIRTLFLNGAVKVYAQPVSDGDYAAAFAELKGKADIIICDSGDEEVIEDMKDALEDMPYCVGIAEFDGSAEECIETAQSMNFERLVILGNVSANAGELAAAFAGFTAYKNDPMTAFNGAHLFGCGLPANEFTTAETEALIAGGVTPVECDGSLPVAVRAVTTKTLTDGVPDKSLRELNTVLSANHVIKTVSEALKIKFASGRNDALTRGAIRSQVLVELERLMQAGVIESYGNVSAVADADDATVCRVGFEYTAAHGLNTIMLTAYLEV